MGVGGSTSRPNSATIIMSNKRPQTSSSDHSITRESSGAHSSPPDNRPTNSCCSHYRENHTGVTRTVTPADPAQKDDSIDDEIEEIVANTLDLVSNQRTSRQPTPHLRDTDRGGGGGGMVMRRDVTSSAASSGSGQRRLLQRSESTRILQKRPSDEDSDSQYDAKDSTPEVDFAKFKKVNHQGATVQSNGRILHHQESDLLWRFGLISPEAYKITTGTRSAPTNQSPYLKTPSYDLTEEQLMANIEKEFECTI